MYPAHELDQLTRRKQQLRVEIALSRQHCVASAAVVAKPIELFDRLQVLWRKVAPLAKLAAVPLLVLLQLRTVKRRGALSLLRRALTMLPTVLSVARGWRGR